MDPKCFSEQGVTIGSGMRQRTGDTQEESDAQYRQDRGWTRLIFLHRERERDACVSFGGNMMVDKHYVRTVAW